jgi:outer membrane biosynthesis protein TonB
MTGTLRYPSSTRLLAAIALLLISGGCAHKTMQSTPAVLVPSIETQPQAETLPPPVVPAATPEPAPVPPQTAEQVQKPRPKPRKPIPHKPAQQTEVSKDAPKPEAQKPPGSVPITAAVPSAAVQSQRQNTENLLRASDDKLAHITRQLSDSEQGMVRQARNYIAQSNQALAAGDTERAYNLAVKASLLANELAK